MAEAVVLKCSVEKVLLKISQNSYENNCPTLLKTKLWDSRFPLNFAKFLRTLFFMEHLW